MIQGLFNFRDTGGTPLVDGGATRSGVLYRSDALGALTETGLEQLAATPIGVVVDFRTDAERAMSPDRLPTTRAIRIVEESILEGAMSGMTQDLMRSAATDPAALTRALELLPSLGELYVGMLRHSAPAFADVARHVAASRDDQPSAVLVHCTAGKDRTGVATALVLEAAGAERTAVVADYVSSAANLAGPWSDGMLAAISAMGAPLTPALTELVTGTPASAIEQALEWVDAEHGGAAVYLQSGGLTDDELAALRARLRG